MNERERMTDEITSLIRVNPQVCHGKPRIAGTHVMVSVVLDSLIDGHSRYEILASYPALRSDDINVSIDYSAMQTGGRCLQEGEPSTDE